MANEKLNSLEFITALDDLSKERRIDKEQLISTIESAGFSSAAAFRAL